MIINQSKELSSYRITVMPGGGLFSLVAYGGQNVLLNDNPSMTYFYKVFRKYSHFSEESVTATFDGPNELSWDQNVQIRLKIQRVADLVRDMYFTFRIPDIYSKYISSTIRDSQYNFAWIRYLGCRIIQNCAFFVGGTKVQEFDGDYIYVKAKADMDTDTFSKWSTLVGDISELTNPALGIYGGGSEVVGYPTVYPDTSSSQQINRPSIFGQDITVPLPFWFGDSATQSLPLVSLQQHDCEIQITLRSIRELYTIFDPSGNRVNPEYKQVAPMEQVQVNLPEYVISNEDSAQIRNFLTDISATVPSLNAWFYNPRLQATYIYLTENERNTFATQPLQYIVYQVTPYRFPAVSKRDLLDMETHNPITRLLIVPRRTDSIPYRNDWTNLTNWYSSRAPYLPTPIINPADSFIWSSGRLITQSQQDIVRTLKIYGDGNELQEDKPASYFRSIVPWKYTSGDCSKSGLLVYPFALTSPNIQPSGSINASRIKNFQVDFNPWPLPNNTNYVYDVTIYVESINWFTVSSGMGGLKYAL